MNLTFLGLFLWESEHFFDKEEGILEVEFFLKVTWGRERSSRCWSDECSLMTAEEVSLTTVDRISMNLTSSSVCYQTENYKHNLFWNVQVLPI